MTSMYSHVTLGTNDLRKAEQFYDAVLGALGLLRRKVNPDGGPPAVCWVAANLDLPLFYIYEPRDGALAKPGNGVMVAFAASTRSQVDSAYAAGMAQGGVDEGVPGIRPHYGEGYYGAYLRDLDGNKLHVVAREDPA